MVLLLRLNLQLLCKVRLKLCSVMSIKGPQKDSKTNMCLCVCCVGSRLFAYSFLCN